jgi:hypothetical protein
MPPKTGQVIVHDKGRIPEQYVFSSAKRQKCKRTKLKE